MMSKKREKRLNVFAGIFVCVFLVVLAGQAFLRILSGDLIGGKNYYGQPVGPVLQFIVVIACLIVIAIMAWRHRRGDRKPDKEKPGSNPAWKMQPPYKYPWE